jgi:hypothetical protein
MIRYLKNNSIDKKKWDEAVSSAAHPSVFALSWYLDAVADDWGGLVLDDYEAVFPLAIKTKYRINVIHQPFFTRYYGVFSKHSSDAQLLQQFADAIPEKFQYIELGLHEHHGLPTGFTGTERRFQVLPLTKNHEDLQKEYSENTRRNIKKAKKAGYKLQMDIDPEVIVKLFRQTKGQDLEIFGPADYQHLKRLMEACTDNKSGYSLGLFDADNKLVAAAFFMKFGDRFTYLKSASTDEGKKLGAMHLLMDQFISRFAGQELLLDFGGSSVESVARFYKAFGGKDCVYLQVKKDRLPRLVKWIKKIKS